MKENQDKVNEGDMWCFYRDMPVHQSWVGEDILFSLRVKALGYKMYCHTGVQLPHKRSYWLKQEHHKDYGRYVEARHQSAQQTVEIADEQSLGIKESK